MNFSSFLRNSKAASNQVCKKIFVLGNEAGDLDSMISSISLAYLESLKSKGINYIPLLNIHRDDLSLRGEICWAFDAFGVERSNLVFISDLDLKLDVSNIILVDHNALGIAQTYLKDRVIGIYDHHKDEKQFLDVCPRVIEPVGSCCSLIMAEWIRSKLHTSLSREISSLILSAILVDTINFQESFGRTSAKDLEAAKILMGILEMDTDQASNLFKKLQKAKNDVKHVSSRDLMRKDHKRWIMEGLSVGISSITWSFSDWKIRELREGRGHEWILSLEGFIKENSFDILCLMTAYTQNDIFCRELFVYIHSSKISFEIFKDNLIKTELQLELIEQNAENKFSPSFLQL